MPSLNLNPRRAMILRRIGDVFGDRLYDNSSDSRSIKADLEYLERHGLIRALPTPEDGRLWRRTEAGDAALKDAT